MRAPSGLRPPGPRRAWSVDRIMERLLQVCAVASVLVTLAILSVLVWESLTFFREVGLADFFLGTTWTPLFHNRQFGVLPLVAGTLLVAGIATIVAVPGGVLCAIYLSEYASPRMRRVVTPLLEWLAAVPTVVYGYVALLLVTPLLSHVVPNLATFNALAPGLVLGLMTLPLVAALSEDAFAAVPPALREAAFALGASRWQTALGVVLPAASSGVMAAAILALARAMGETMVVAIAAGHQPRLTLDPRGPVETLTAFIVQVSLGDTPSGTLAYRTIFAVGMLLFVGTLALNVVSDWLRARVRAGASV